MKSLLVLAGVTSLVLLGGWFAKAYESLYSPLEKSRQEVYGQYTSDIVVLEALSHYPSVKVSDIQTSCMKSAERFNRLSKVSNRHSPLPTYLETTKCL